MITYGDNEISIYLEEPSKDQQESSGKDAARKGNIALGQDFDRAETKNVLKQLLYDLLSAYTGQKLPWGNLTGIRPTKIPMGLLEKGWKNTEIAAYMRVDIIFKIIFILMYFYHLFSHIMRKDCTAFHGQCQWASHVPDIQPHPQAGL